MEESRALDEADDEADEDMKRKRGAPVAFLSLAFALSACSSAPRPVQSPSADDPVARALSASLERRGWDDLRIESECLNAAGELRFATLYGSRVGIWNRDRQFTVPRERLIALLEELDRAGFGAMREIHGGAGEPASRPPGRAARAETT